MKHSAINDRDDYYFEGRLCRTVGRPDSDPSCELMMVWADDPETVFYCTAADLTLAKKN